MSESIREQIQSADVLRGNAMDCLARIGDALQTASLLRDEGNYACLQCQFALRQILSLDGVLVQLRQSLIRLNDHTKATCRDAASE